MLYLFIFNQLILKDIFLFVLHVLIQVAKRKYQQEYDLAPPITFGTDHIALDIPDDGIQTNNGWEIVPLQKPQV